MVRSPFVVVYWLFYSRSRIAGQRRRTTELLSIRYCFKLLLLLALHAAFLTVQPTVAMRFLSRQVPISTLVLRIPIRSSNTIDSLNANPENLAPPQGPRVANSKIIILADKGESAMPTEDASVGELSELSDNPPLLLSPMSKESQKRAVDGLVKRIDAESNSDEMDSTQGGEDQLPQPSPIKRIRRHAVMITASGFPFRAIKNAPGAFMEATSEKENNPLITVTEPETVAPKASGLTPAPHLFYALESR